MLFLHMTNTLPGRPAVVGPAPWFQLSRNLLRIGPSGEVIAEYMKNNWRSRRDHFTEISCRDRACVHFEDIGGSGSGPLGPYDRLTIADRVMRADGQVLAKFLDDLQMWHCYETAHFWPSMMIKPSAG
jgi:hypothetical protein